MTIAETMGRYFDRARTLATRRRGPAPFDASHPAAIELLAAYEALRAAQIRVRDAQRAVVDVGTARRGRR